MTSPSAFEDDDVCVFCEIVAGRVPADVVHDWPEVIVIKPLLQAAPGHVLVIPRRHVRDVASDPAVSALAMTAAAELAGTMPSANVITSRGLAATQTVFHLHLHVVPRYPGDGLTLPWGIAADRVHVEGTARGADA